LKKEQCNK